MLISLWNTIVENEKISEAEEQFGKVIKLAEKFSKDVAIQQVLGWTLSVRGHVLKGKSLYDQGLVVLEEAERIFESIYNFAGMVHTNMLMADVYSSLGNPSSADRCRKKAQQFREKAKAER